MGEYEIVQHEFEPVYNENSRILILGTIPSVKSRENHFYYGHPQNRFWKVLAELVSCELPQTIEEKKQMLLLHKIAVWDVLKSCEIVGSGDSSIRAEIPNEILPLLQKTQIKKVFTNGKKAEAFYQKYCRAETGVESVCLPSTSPANAAWSLDKLVQVWRKEMNPFLID
ncbi:DNA-deoxyinosine glycosylase [Scatolibacter rhodanostii]|uniref:DNA-deoxyinosine glycosylase n=1 Tax=Scatolibacter rhodanostii TaxID=2014781 RepID=UPI000C06CDC8|nr:DNA-deoxyinosine glycosylase [Scatolibacter rhodanostii]